jgi:hypothetical protein
MVKSAGINTVKSASRLESALVRAKPRTRRHRRFSVPIERSASILITNNNLQAEALRFKILCLAFWALPRTGGHLDRSFKGVTREPWR